MGGGTGTAAVCEIAKTAKEQNIFTVAVVSMPFTAEGLLRITVAENGLKELKEYTKAVFVAENDKIFSYIGDTASWTVNFGVIDSVTAEAINSIITTIVNNNAGAGIDIYDLRYMAENSKQITLKRGVGSTIEEAFNNATANNIYGKFDISKAERIFLTTVYDKNAAIIPDIKYLNDEIKNKFSNYKSCKIQTLQQSNRNYIQIIMILSF
jgi:cell division protein FtsZ